MKLLREINENIEYLTEAANDGKKNYFLEGIFLQGDTKNRNGRIYPVDVLGKEVQRYNENYVSKNRAFGELDHPTTPSVNLTRASHLITELKQDGNNFVGKAKVLTGTTNGKVLKALMDEKCSLGVSSRGLGALKERNGAKVVEQYFITTAADVVADPSAPEAYPQNVIENVVENMDWFFDGREWKTQEKASQLVENFKRHNRSEREAMFLREFNKLLNN